VTGAGVTAKPALFASTARRVSLSAEDLLEVKYLDSTCGRDAEIELDVEEEASIKEDEEAEGFHYLAEPEVTEIKAQTGHELAATLEAAANDVPPYLPTGRPRVLRVWDGVCWTRQKTEGR
jgi:hypothetical protein